MAPFAPRTALRALALSAFLAPSIAAGPVPRHEPAPAAVLGATGLRHATVERLELPAAPPHRLAPAAGAFEVDVALNGSEERLVLAPHSVRAAGFRLLVQGPDGELREEAPAPAATYRGHVRGYPESVVAGTLVDGRLSALLRLAPDLAAIGIEPLAGHVAGADRAEHLVYDAADTAPRPGACGLDDSAARPEAGEAAAPEREGAGRVGGGAGSVAGAATDEAQIAIDIDVEYFELNGGTVFAAHGNAETFVNMVEAIYEAQTGIAYEISAIVVRTAEPDPYGTTSPSGLLNQLRNHWQFNLGSIERDQTHLLTGRDLSGSTIGIANLNSICGNGNGYGLSQAKFGGATLVDSTGLIAHELGHNWNATHCNGLPGCAIMCDNLGGCTGSVSQFSPSSVSRIVAKKNASGSCLEAPAPALPVLDGSASPSTVSAFRGGTVTFPGTQLGELSEVRVAGEVVPAARWASNWGTMQLIEAPLLDVGTVDVEVTNAAGTTGGATVEVLEATAVDFWSPALSVAGQPLLLEWSGGAGNAYFVSFSLDGLTIPVGQYDVLATPNLGLSGTLSPAGTDFLYLPAVGSFGFVTLWFQVLVFDSQSGAFLGASAVLPTLFL